MATILQPRAIFPKFLMKSIGKFLPLSLIDECSQEKLNTFLTCLPAELEAHMMGFESSLREKESWGDLHFAFPVGSRAFSLLSKSPPFEDRLWKEIPHLLEELNDQLDDYGVFQIVLEFDVGSCSDWPPLPNVFFLLQKGKKDPFEFISKMSHRLCPEFSASALNSLHKYIKEVDPTSIAFMLARSPKCLRVTVSSIKPENAELLNKLFPESNFLEKYTMLLKLLQSDGPFFFSNFIRVVLEITHEGALFTKIEICIGNPRDSQGIPRSVLEHFVNCGLLNQEKKSALLAYTGLHAEPFFDLPSDFLRLFHRKIHHLKLAIGSEQNIQEALVKAYLSVECKVCHQAALSNLDLRGNIA